LSAIYKYIDNVTVVDFPNSETNAYKSRYLKTKCRNLIKGDFLYIDTDTIIIDNLTSLDDLDIQVGAVKDLHQTSLRSCRYINFIIEKAKMLGWNDFNLDIPYYNGGVLYWKDSDESHLFAQTWHEAWLLGYDKGVKADQPTLAMVNSKSNTIKELPPEWNCQLLGNGIPYLRQAKIIHYFNASKFKSIGEMPFKFMEDSILLRVRKAGLIDSYLHTMIVNPALAFPAQIDLISGNSISVYYSKIFMILLTLKAEHKTLYNCIEKCCSLLFNLALLIRKKSKKV
jgi:hypothetical protein